MNIRKIGVKDKINMEDRDNILEILKILCSGDGCTLELESYYLKRYREIVMATVNQDGGTLEFASEDL